MGLGAGGGMRVRRHFNYSNVMSTLAVFLVVAGGSALAASVKHNSVRSGSIKNNAVKSKDLKNGKAVASRDVIDDSLTGKDVKDNSLAGSDVADNSLTGDDVANSSLSGAEITDGTLHGEDVANESLTGSDIGDGTVATADLAGHSVISSKLGAVTRFSKSASIPANSFGTAIATCPAGSIALSGGGRPAQTNMQMVALSKENVSEAWVYQANNPNGTAQGITAFVYCLAR